MLHIRKGVLRTETILWAEKHTDETLTNQLEGGGMGLPFHGSESGRTTSFKALDKIYMMHNKDHIYRYVPKM